MIRRCRFLAFSLLLGLAAAVVGPVAWALDEPSLSADEREQLRQQIREAHRQRMLARHQLEQHQRANGSGQGIEPGARFGRVERERLPIAISQDERQQLRHQLRERQTHPSPGSRRFEAHPAGKSDAAGMVLPASADSPLRASELIDASARGGR